MNFILNDSNTSIGGIEVLFLEMVEYLSKNNHNVYFIVNDTNSIYEKYLENHKNIFFIRKKITKPVEYSNNKELIVERENTLSQFPSNEIFHVISPYFNSLQYAMAVFGSEKRFKLMNLWPHPQSWANSLVLKRNNNFVKKKVKNSKYYYQKNLLKNLEKNNADYYGARIVPVFNNWYYEIDLNPFKIETLPIETVENIPKRFRFNTNKKTISILWCGRFAYSKNEAIIHIYNTLEVLAGKYSDWNIYYGIIGFGSKKDTDYIKQNIKTNKVQVEFIGKVNPDDLIDIFKKYDVGIGMGLTVKKMGQIGLPAIVIDSFEQSQPHKKNSNWLFDTSEGDAGDGYYFNIAGQNIENRVELYELLEKVFKNPKLLENYSKKCIEYVEKNYSFKKQVEKILNLAKESEFYGQDYPIYRRNWFVRKAYSLYKNLKKLI